MKKYCKIHPKQILRKSIKEYCPICEGWFSGHGVPDIKRCPFKWKMEREDPRDKGRAFPLVKGKVSHFDAEVFNKSLKFINKNKFEITLNKIFKNYNNFRNYLKLMLNEEIIKSTEKEIYSLYLYKKEMFESFCAEGVPFNIIPIIAEEWLFIPFDEKQYKLALVNGVNMWTKIGVHNVLDEVFLDTDGRAICIDYKGYPREGERQLSEIKKIDRKYQLLTAMLTFEYTYDIDVKYVANVELGSSGFPNISYHKPTSRGITYYKKALLEAYNYIFNDNFPPKFEQFTCINWCEYKVICPHPEIKKWRQFRILNMM